MILAYADASVDDPLYAVGYVLYRTDGPQDELLDTGCRVWNATVDSREIDWCIQTAEYYAGIIATRAALEYTHHPIVLCLDNREVVESMKQQDGRWDEYFSHALLSFLPRFDDYTIRVVHRTHNETAHRQASTGLQIAREIHEEVV